MFWPLLRSSPTTPLNATRLPPKTVTSYCVPPEPPTGATLVTVAVVVPRTLKTVVSTAVTALLNVARKTSVVAFVANRLGVSRTNDVVLGATWSRTQVLLSVPVGVVFASGAPSASVRSEEHTSELQSQFHLVCRL